MTPLDSAKAAGAAAVVLALNLLLTVGAIFGYAQLIEPGRPSEYYNAIAPQIAAWSAPPGGFLLMLGAGWWLGRRRPERRAHLFALAVFLAYLVIDTATGLAAAPIEKILTPLFALSMALAALGGQIGAWLSRRGR